MQRRDNLQAFEHYAYIAIYALALTRDHETWPGGESRRRDWLRHVPSPLEGRFAFSIAIHWRSYCLGLRGMARAAAGTTCFRRPPRHETPPARVTKTPLRGYTKAPGNATAHMPGGMSLRNHAGRDHLSLFVRREGGVRVRRERRRRQSRCDAAHVARRLVLRSAWREGGSLRPTCDTAHQGCVATRLDVVGFRGRA